MPPVLVLRTTASPTMLLWRWTRFVPRLRIPTRLLIVSTRLLLKPTLLLHRPLLESTLLLRLPRLLFESTLLWLHLRLTDRFPPLLKFRPALRSAIVVERLWPVVAFVPVEPHGALGSKRLRTSTIIARIEVTIVPRRFHVVHLHRGCVHMSIAHRLALFRPHIMANSVTPAVEGNTPLIHDRIPLYDSAINVHIANVHIVHADDGRVVEEVVSVPISTGETNSHISESIIIPP